MILIPMAGMSSRFFNAGFKLPKYMLEAQGKSLFEHSVCSFEYYFDKLPFLFIVRSDYDTPSFVKASCEKLGIHKYEIVVLDGNTRGQAETVALGLSETNWQGSLTIFNIDTFRPGFRFPANLEVDGYLEVFRGSGSNWSFVMTESLESTRVIKTTEKDPISNLCSTGLYYFSSKDTFLEAYNKMLALPRSEWPNGELYIAPLYNYLIQDGLDIQCEIIERKDVVFCGIPEEYLALQNGQTTSKY
ncbi:glycosyltransferase family 2 protein [Ferrimonas kyonanensis]|uniref:glycosyltransferase family 2 protein n=1 Tax=Ferrimonas kyonanensis TaxID=364763 RepID=UPI000485C05C|nr:glycosyltransferase family 2 protein [Ferrimonas kyonanensis]